MSEIPKDIAATREALRAQLAATAMRHLGPDREQDAERLVDLVMASLEGIRAAAWIAYAPAAPLPEAIGQELNEQLRQHGERWVRVSFEAVIRTFHQALHVAAGREP
jgi:hypothetical protein